MNSPIKDKKSVQSNPLVKMIEDKKRITDTINSGKKITDLKDIKFVQPL